MLVYGKYECVVMHMLYVCVYSTSCGSSQFCMTCSLLMLVEDERGDHLAPNDTAYTRWSCHSSLANPVQIVSTPPPPVLGARF